MSVIDAAVRSAVFCGAAVATALLASRIISENRAHPPETRALHLCADVKDMEMSTHVCAACGENYDYTHAPPVVCPKCGGEMIATA